MGFADSIGAVGRERFAFPALIAPTELGIVFRLLVAAAGAPRPGDAENCVSRGSVEDGADPSRGGRVGGAPDDASVTSRAAIGAAAPCNERGAGQNRQTQNAVPATMAAASVSRGRLGFIRGVRVKK